MSDYISREAAKNALRAQRHRFTVADEANGYGSVKWSEYIIYAEAAENAIDAIPAADVKPVRPIIDRMNEERKRAKGNWHTDPYWLGWVDAMGRAQRIVDGTIDDEPMYAPSIARKEGSKGD